MNYDNIQTEVSLELLSESEVCTHFLNYYELTSDSLCRRDNLGIIHVI